MASLSRFKVLLVLVALASAGAYALACDSDGGSGSNDPNSDDGGTLGLPDAVVGQSDAEAPATTMRLAHVASMLGPVDFCYRAAESSSFEGPVLGGGVGGGAKDGGGTDAGEGGDASSADDLDAGVLEAGSDTGSAEGGAASVGYRTVSRYLTLQASGPLTIALVEPGSTSCATPLLMANVTLDPGKLATVAIVGGPAPDGGTAELSLVAFIDDRTTTPAKARVRMIHAALGSEGGRAAAPALAVRASSTATITIADRVEPRSAASPSAAVPVDSLGYATLEPVPSPARLAVGAAPSTPVMGDAGSVDSWISGAGELGLVGASLHTGFVLSGAGDAPYEVLWCTDTSTSGDLTTCALVR